MYIYFVTLQICSPLDFPKEPSVPSTLLSYQVFTIRLIALQKLNIKPHISFDDIPTSNYDFVMCLNKTI